MPHPSSPDAVLATVRRRIGDASEDLADANRWITSFEEAATGWSASQNAEFADAMWRVNAARDALAAPPRPLAQVYPGFVAGSSDWCQNCRTPFRSGDHVKGGGSAMVHVDCDGPQGFPLTEPEATFDAAMSRMARRSGEAR